MTRGGIEVLSEREENQCANDATPGFLLVADVFFHANFGPVYSPEGRVKF